METRIMKVVSCGQMQQVASQKSENGVLCKRQVVLAALGSQYEDQIAASMLGNLAQCAFQSGEIVAVALRFRTSETGGRTFQDVTVTEMQRLTR